MMSKIPLGCLLVILLTLDGTLAIIGGEPAPEGTFPFIAAWGTISGIEGAGNWDPGWTGFRFLCGGVIINERTIVTSAYTGCWLYGHWDKPNNYAAIVGVRVRPDTAVVRDGDWFKKEEESRGAQLVGVESFQRHPCFKDVYNHDIAFARTKTPIVWKAKNGLPTVYPVLLAKVEEMPVDDMVEIFGWGARSDDMQMISGQMMKCHSDFCTLEDGKGVCAADRDRGGPVIGRRRGSNQRILMGIISLSGRLSGRHCPEIEGDRVTLPDGHTDVRFYGCYIEAGQFPPVVKYKKDCYKKKSEMSSDMTCTLNDVEPPLSEMTSTTKAEYDGGKAGGVGRIQALGVGGALIIALLI